MNELTRDDVQVYRNMVNSHRGGVWTVDECPDANGHWTIRLADGSPNGNTEAEPIATVFDRQEADFIVLWHNKAIFSDAMLLEAWSE